MLKNKKNKPIILKDSKDIRNIIIKLDLKKNTTSVFSGFSAWENLALILEGLGVTAEKCIQEGISKKQVIETIKEHIMKVLLSYKIKNLS